MVLRATGNCYYVKCVDACTNNLTSLNYTQCHYASQWQEISMRHSVKDPVSMTDTESATGSDLYWQQHHRVVILVKILTLFPNCWRSCGGQPSRFVDDVSKAPWAVDEVHLPHCQWRPKATSDRRLILKTCTRLKQFLGYRVYLPWARRDKCQIVHTRRSWYHQA